MLELKNITKTFNLTGTKEDLRVALNNVNLSVAPGEFVTIIGSNGSGKSTSLNIISGSLKPDKGLVLLNSVDITKLKEYKRAAYFGRVFQDPMMGTAADMSVLENLEVAYRRGRFHSPLLWGFRGENRKYFIHELKRFGLGLETRLSQKVGVMSGGQRQALTLLMATIRQRPSVRRMRKDYVTFSSLDDYDYLAISMRNDYIKEIKHKYDVDYFKEVRGFKALQKDGKDIGSETQEHKNKLASIKKEKKEELNAFHKRFLKAKEDKHRIKHLAKCKFDNAYSRQKGELLGEIQSIKKSDSKNKRNEILEAKMNFMDRFAAEYDLTKQILLLDEHTAALDPKTAKKVLELTEKIVRENHMTTLMVTHNMKDALTYGDRLIMFHGGNIILDVKGDKKKRLTTNDLLKMFDEADKKAEQE